MMYEFLESKNCNICQSDQFQVLYSYPENFYDHDQFETASWDGRQSYPAQIVKCSSCGLVYSHPSFKEEYLHWIYPEEVVKSDLNFQNEVKSGQKKYKQILEAFSEFNVKESVCDIGSRYGVLPYLASSLLGIEGFGIEFNAAAVEFGKANNSDIYQGTVLDLPRILRERQLDYIEAVSMDDVLEHLIDPLADLETIASVQRSGGLLFLRQMDLNSLGHRKYGEHWHYIQPAAHMYYFNEASIDKLLDKAGYDVVSVSRYPDWKNHLKMANRTLRDFSRQLRGKKKPSRMLNGKQLYLDQRPASHDDMFLVVARKR